MSPEGAAGDLRGGTRAGSLRHALLACGMAAAAALASGTLGGVVFGHRPHVSDECSYAFQARLFASLRLAGEPPPVAEAFSVGNVILKDGVWCSKYPPGWSVLLAAGFVAGVPWAVDPLLLGLLVLGTFRLGRALYDPETALLGALLVSVSPFALMTGAGFMAHVASAAASVWSLVLLLSALQTGRPARSVGSGLLAGLAFTIRPVSALFLIGPLALLLLLRHASRAKSARLLAALTAGGLIPVLFLLGYQWSVFGSPWLSGYAVSDPLEGYTGIGLEKTGLFTIAARHLPWYLFELGRSLWGFPFGDLLLVALAFLRPRKEDLFPALPALGLVLGYSGYYYFDVLQGGPRLAFEAVPFLSLLAARGLRNVWTFLAARISRHLRAATAWLPASGAAAALALAAWPPLRTLPPLAHQLSLSYHEVLNDPLRGAREAGLGDDALVLVRVFTEVAGYGPRTGPTYQSFAYLNAPDPRTGSRVFARDIPGLEPALRAAYPRKETWRCELVIRPAMLTESSLDSTWVVLSRKWVRLGDSAGAAGRRDGGGEGQGSRG